MKKANALTEQVVEESKWSHPEHTSVGVGTKNQYLRSVAENRENQLEA